MQEILSLQDGIECVLIISRSPKLSHMNYHTTTPKILDRIIISLVLIPTEKHTKPLDLFLTLDAVQIQSSRFFQSSSPNVVLFLINYHTQTPNPTHTSSFQNIRPFNFFLITKKPLSSSSACLKYIPPNFIPSLPNNLPANFLVET